METIINAKSSKAPTPEQVRKIMTVVFIFQIYSVFIDPDFILIIWLSKLLDEVLEGFQLEVLND